MKNPSLVGQKFGKWLVCESLSRKAKNGGKYYRCRCEGCQQLYDVAASSLVEKKSHQCWQCVLKFRRTNTKAVCVHGHDIELWGRTPSKACKACVKHKSLMRCYGITLEEFIALYEYQKGKCAVCGKALGPYFPSVPGWFEKHRIEVDHDHDKVGKESVRGLLCGGRWAGCNRKLGRIDSLEWLGFALRYVTNPPAVTFFKGESKCD